MNPEIKAQWVTALRSGEYKQGKGYLNRGGKFCCLGVLCDIAEKAGVVETQAPSDSPYVGGVQYKNVDEDGHTYYVDAYPPNGVREWAGLERSDPLTRIRHNETSQLLTLSMLNDGPGDYDFAKIADIIEEPL
jgi:hypothetical protein